MYTGHVTQDSVNDSSTCTCYFVYLFNREDGCARLFQSAESVCIFINAPEGCRHGTHTTVGRPTRHTRHLLESTHTNTHTHKRTHNAARQSTVRAHAVAAPSSSEEGASSPPFLSYPQDGLACVREYRVKG